MTRITEVPGYVEAILKEKLIRGAAFLPVTEKINGFQVRPMTLTHYTLLSIMGSPFMPPFRDATAHDLIAFLWVVSGEHSTNPKDFERFIKRKCRSLIPSKLLFVWRWGWIKRPVETLSHTQSTMDSAREYVSEALMDMPRASGRSNYTPEYFSDAACLCALLAREYGYSVDQVMDMPMKRIFQFLNEMKQYHSADSALWNPLSTRAIGEHLAKANQKN